MTRCWITQAIFWQKINIKWKKANLADAAERSIKTAAKLMKNKIKCYEDITEYYAGAEDTENKCNLFIPPLLKN